MFEQRVATDEAARETSGEVWVPAGWAEPVKPVASDWYVVVDELMDGTVVLAYAPWPRLDAVGRLSFGDAATDADHALSLPEELFQDAVNVARREAVQVADPEVTDRPLRVGDAFLVRRLEPGDPPVVEVVADVTVHARTAAKTALYAAVAPKVGAEEAAALNLTTEAEDEGPPDPPPPGPSTAAPAV